MNGLSAGGASSSAAGPSGPWRAVSEEGGSAGQKEFGGAKRITTKTTTTRTTTTAVKNNNESRVTDEKDEVSPAIGRGKQLNGGGDEEVATVQHLGRQVEWSSLRGRDEIEATKGAQGVPETRVNPEAGHYSGLLFDDPTGVEGNKLVTSIGTIAAQSSQSRVVVALLKDGDKLQLKIQEMRPGIFEVGTNLGEARKFLLEHGRVMDNLDKQRQAPLECWMSKYKRLCDDHELRSKGQEMSTEMRMVFMCMAENLQGCWRALWWQLEQRRNLLREASNFYQLCDNLNRSLERAENHVQTFRQVFLDGPNAAGLRFNQAANELKSMNSAILNDFRLAKEGQKQFVELIGKIAMGNLADSRKNHLVPEAQNLINFILNYLDPLERRKIQLENVITTTTTNSRTTMTSTTSNSLTSYEQQVNGSPNVKPPISERKIGSLQAGSGGGMINYANKTASGHQHRQVPLIRNINNFNDLNLVDDWLRLKTDQLNSSLLSSLGVSTQDTRSILNKHEQIALECSAIEEATLNFNGKNIHALKAAPPAQQPQGNQLSRGPNNGAALGGQSKQADDEDQTPGGSTLFDQQKALATRARDVITILDARLSLLRRTIDFYYRAKEATSDITKWTRRLQVDNSLQSVQFVSNELELKDVSAVVASGATILSELQQLQLAQQHGQRSKVVNLNLVTSGIRTVIDELNQDLAHLKATLHQRRLVLLNEDASKMASNFSSKCHQLQVWLNNHVKSYLMSNNRIRFEPNSVKGYINGHEDMRLAVQNKTAEVEALLRLLATMGDSLEAKNETGEEIQRDCDELRQDWINVTNCLDRRIELARKFLAILTSGANIGHDLDSLNLEPRGANQRPRTPDERTDEDIWAQIEQGLLQLENQVKNFSQDSLKCDTRLLHSAGGLDTKSPVDDVNKEQVVAHASGALRLLTERHRSVMSKLNAMGRAPLPGPLQRLGPWSPTFKAAARAERAADQQQRAPPARRSEETGVGKASALPAEQTGPKVAGNQEGSAVSGSGAGGAGGNAGGRGPQAGSSRKQQAGKGPLGPSFVRGLEDKVVEPFSTVQLECETEPVGSAGCRLEWLLNNKRIPTHIKHSILNDGHKHKLVISQFNPTCCGTYTARALNLETGRSASSSCRLQLAGIKEVADSPDSAAHPSETPQEQGRPHGALSSSSTTKTTTTTTTTTSTNGDTELRQSRPGQRAPAGATGQHRQQRAMERIIQGVESPPASLDEQTPERVLANQRRPANGQPTRPDANRMVTKTVSSSATFGSSQTSGLPQNSTGDRSTKSSNTQTHVAADGSHYLVEPARSETSRSVSRSSFGATPQTGDGVCCSRPGLVCVVVGNPPPTVEWLHNNRPIAQARCSPGSAANLLEARGDSRSGVCKLTIQTGGDQPRGQFGFQAANHLGPTSNALTLGQ